MTETTARTSRFNTLIHSKKSKLLAGVAGSTIGALLLSGCSAGEPVSREQFKAEFIQKYQKAFDQASPVGKFALQYLGQEQRRVHKYPHAGFDSTVGQAGYEADAVYWVGKMNDGCLDDTAYDINGGTFKVTGSWWEAGLLSAGSGSIRGLGDTPTAAAFAEVNPKNNDQLIVESGHSDAVKLVFNGLNGGTELVPANEQTKDILFTYGCDEGISTLSIHQNPVNINR